MDYDTVLSDTRAALGDIDDSYEQYRCDPVRGRDVAIATASLTEFGSKRMVPSLPRPG